ncbi:MAG: hypothetical protein M0017_06910 [Desulfobacteraceae bacterium]|nr:hypothetical protein [Desulfobacteraceae bacterium]
MNVRELYRLALEQVLAGRPRGTQGLMADHFGIKRSRMNDYVKGRIPIPESKRAIFAEYLGASYEEMLSLGRRLAKERRAPAAHPGTPYETAVPPEGRLTMAEERREWPYAPEAERYGSHTEERAWFIWEKGCGEMGIPGLYDRQAHSAFIERYQRGELSDAELYRAAREHAKGWIKRIKELK